MLIWAEVRSNSQSAVKVVVGALARDPGADSPVVVQESPVSASLDGRQQLGMLACLQALAIAQQKARQAGIALVGVHNTSSSTGALGCAVHLFLRT